MQKAIIDLGTNTFHLLVVEDDSIIFAESIASKIGSGGINQNIILPAAFERALSVLKVFRDKIDKFNISEQHIYAFGTSALRNAKNANEFIESVQLHTKISIKIIDGDEEANLIYLGVRKAIQFSKTSLIVDIGGGSVEFIIGNSDKIFWKKSFEIGGLRLMEKFMKNDPISPSEINKMDDYFLKELLPLSNAIHQYQPLTLIGSSGSFDTLNDMFYAKRPEKTPPKNQVGFDYSIEEFIEAYEKLILKNREERLKIEGMIELRVDMIVVAVCLIRFLLLKFKIKEIKISNYSLKEGVLEQILTKNAH
jgi:exopolyphosphatase/guanosine-5'-triphosphate,3'-diphosphate pyrophosphatase